MPQNLESGADFDQVGIEVLASGLYHWKFQSVGFSYCGYLQGQNIGIMVCFWLTQLSALMR